MIIGISGRIGAGKDTLAQVMQAVSLHMSHSSLMLLSETDRQQVWKIKKYAGKLKQVVSLLTGIPVEDLERADVKNSFLGPEWGTHCTVSGDLRFKFPTREAAEAFISRRNYNMDYMLELKTVRALLQQLGTDAIRNAVHPDAWINALFADYQGIPATILHDDCPVNPGPFEITEDMEVKYSHVGLLYPNWIITDLRFPNEAKAIKDRGGITVRIEREEAYTSGPAKNLHSSETALDRYDFDYVIVNNGTIQELQQKVLEIPALKTLLRR